MSMQLMQWLWQAAAMMCVFIFKASWLKVSGFLFTFGYFPFLGALPY